MRGGSGAIDAQVALQDRARREGDIGDAGAEHACGIEVPRHGLHPDHRDQPVRGLERRDAAERRRTDHRTGGLRAVGERYHPGGDGGRRSRGRAAGRMGDVVRIARRRRHQRRELGGHSLADDDAAGLAGQNDGAGVGGRSMPGIDRRAVLRRQVGSIEYVLKADRQAV